MVSCQPLELRKLFELTDVDGDGLISLDDFVLMGLHQTKLHAGPQKPRNRHEEEKVKEAFVQRFAHEIDAGPVVVIFFSFVLLNYVSYDLIVFFLYVL